MRYRVLNAIVDLRKAAADVVVLADAAVYGKASDAALPRLPQRIRLLQLQAQKALLTLEDLE